MTTIKWIDDHPSAGITLWTLAHHLLGILPRDGGRAPFLSQPAWPATYVPALVEKNGVLMVIQWNFMVF